MEAHWSIGSWVDPINVVKKYSGSSRIDRLQKHSGSSMIGRLQGWSSLTLSRNAVEFQGLIDSKVDHVNPVQNVLEAQGLEGSRVHQVDIV